MLRVAALGDIHYRLNFHGGFRSIFRAVSRQADLVVIAGDLTGLGLPEEARILAKELSIVDIPKVAVLGNHDCHSRCEGEVRTILEDGGLIILDGEAYRLEIGGISVGMAGVKGFCGGFGVRQITPFGEDGIKDFLKVVEHETEKLDDALSRLDTDIRLALLHYSPVSETLAGESMELYPFLGCSMLSLPLDKHRVDLALHGHAHHGVEHGRTAGGVPVRNVAIQVLRRYYTVYDIIPDGRRPG